MFVNIIPTIKSPVGFLLLEVIVQWFWFSVFKTQGMELQNRYGGGGELAERKPVKKARFLRVILQVQAHSYKSLIAFIKVLLRFNH